MTLNGYTNKSISGIIFDKDGTLLKVDNFWNNVYRDSVQALISKNNLCSDHESFEKVTGSIYKAIGLTENGLIQNSVASIGSVKEVFSEIKLVLYLYKFVNLDKLTLEDFEAHVTEQVYNHANQIDLMFSSTLEGLMFLKKSGIKLALITTDSRNNTIFMLKHFKVYDYFDYIGCGDDDIPTKPSPDQGIDFMTSFEKATNNYFMVGDSKYDIQFAASIGAKYIDVTSINGSFFNLINFFD